jgi:hypothetical protein
MRLVVLFILALFAVPAQAQDFDRVATKAAECRQYLTELGLLGDQFKLPPWDCREEPAKSLSQALQYGLEFWGEDNPGYALGVNSSACTPLIKAGLSDCNYNMRLVLVGFLAMYGVHLFPLSDNDKNDAPGDTSYSGKGNENAVLIATVRKNVGLFSDGDLTAEEVQLWR